MKKKVVSMIYVNIKVSVLIVMKWIFSYFYVKWKWMDIFLIGKRSCFWEGIREN